MAPGIERLANTYNNAKKFGEEKTVKIMGLTTNLVKEYITRYKRLPIFEKKLAQKRLKEKENKNKSVDTVVLSEREDIKKKDKVKELTKKYSYALKEIEELESKTNFIEEAKRVITLAKPLLITPKVSSNSTEATSFMVASDWHVEETVEPNSVNGLNQYNLEIARKRITNFFTGSMRLIDIQRNGVKIKNNILALLGDFITGYIHEEYPENNSLSPTQAITFLYELFISGINFLIKDGKFEKITVICCFGNHGRTTQKKRITTGYKNSYEWLLYWFLKQHYKDNDKVEFIIPESSLVYIQVYKYVFRLMHGDSVRYSGGIGGVTIPLFKKINEWDKGVKANYTVCGHFHQAVDDRNVIVNSSIIGYNAFGISIGAPFEEPQQRLFLVDEKRGKTISCPVYV